MTQFSRTLKKHVLVIDDDKLILAIAKDFLEEAGFEASTTSSVMKANKHIHSDRPPDAILVDVVMPFLNGPDFVGVMKENGATKDIPVILISSKPEEELEVLSRSAGADGYLPKPLDRERLSMEISRLL